MVQAERVHHERAESRPPGADDVDGRHVADVPGGSGIDAHQVERDLEDAGVRLHHSQVAGVDDELDRDADPGTDLADLEARQTLAHQPVGVRHDPQADVGGGQGREALLRARDRFDPQRGVGELAVDVTVGLGPSIGFDAAFLDVGLQVGEPCVGPAGLDVDVDGETSRGAVVGRGQCRRVDGALGTLERGDHPLPIGEDEDAAGVEEDRFGCGNGGHRANVASSPSAPHGRVAAGGRGHGGDIES